MNLVRSIAFSLALGTSALAVACGGTVEHSPQTAVGTTKAPIGTNTHGAVKLIGDALGEVALRPEQRTEIEKLAADAEARHAPTAEGRKELMIAFADQVEKGAIDRAALQGKLDKVTADLEKVRTDDRAAFVRLHTILDPDQRSAFVDALHNQMKSKHGEHKEHMAVGFGHMKQLADEMKLTETQRTQIHDMMREGFKKQMKEHHPDGTAPAEAQGRKAHHGGPHGGHHPGGGVLEAFRGESFDLDKVAPPHDMKAMTNAGSQHMTGFVEKVLPVLTPEQRKIAADKIRTMAASGDSSLLVH